MDTNSIRNPVGDSSKKNKRRKRKERKKANKTGELLNMDQMNDNSEIPNTGKICFAASNNLQNPIIELDSTTQLHEEQSRSTENISEETVQRKRRRRRRRKHKKIEAKIKDELQSVDQMDDNLEIPNVDIGCIVHNSDLQNNLFELDSTAQSHAEQSKMDTRLTENLIEGTMKRKKRRRKHNKKRANTKSELQIVNCMSSLNLSDINHGIGNDGKLITNESTAPSFHLVNDTMSHFGLCKRNKASLAPVDIDSKSYSVFVERGSGPSEGPKEMEVGMFSRESQHITIPNKMYGKNEKIENEFNEEEIIVYQGKDSAVCSSSDMEVEVIKQLSFPILKQDHLSNDSCPYLKIPPVASVRRKLLVLDVNGLLADIVMPAPKDCIADTRILGRAVFRRPFCDDFLKFCFDKFNVAIWSSRSKKIIEKVVNYLLGDLQHKLLFCWDVSQSTQTSFKTLENMHKPLVMKELKKIWEKDDPNLPWERGYYNETNTLLLDDSPYKALLNPLHTAIFPYSYHYKDKSDNSLGPGGNLRVYLEDMLKCDNVKKYVEQHPFGQGAIDETNEFWSFYSRVLESVSAPSSACSWGMWKQ